jgi:hypothetical protein
MGKTGEKDADRRGSAHKKEDHDAKPVPPWEKSGFMRRQV